MGSVMLMSRRVMMAMAVVLAVNVAGVTAQTLPGEAIPGSECTVDPRPLSFLADLVQTPIPEATPVPFTAIPEGPEPDEATRDELTTAVRQYIACINGGEHLRAFALLTDAYLRRIADPTGELGPEVATEIGYSFSTPVPLEPTELVYLVSIREMHVMQDGRVAVVIETTSESQRGALTADLLIYLKVDDRWLVDDGVANIDEVTKQSGE